MTNNEIDIRLKQLSQAIPELAKKRYLNQTKKPIEIELELLNMSAMAIFTMLGEIAKRLPEVKNETEQASG